MEPATFPGALIPIHYHTNMLTDDVRMTAFVDAIAKVVRPGDVVVDLGGGTGVLSWLAARNGAAKVWCVEKIPALADFAARNVARNDHGERVEVVCADATEFVPACPVDVVVCEMLHTGLLREHQIAVIDAFKRNYLRRFGGPLPTFLPEATLQAVQLVHHDFGYWGYTAPAPLFQACNVVQPRTTELSAPALFQTVLYDEALPTRCSADCLITIDRAGELNAVRIITKNVLSADLSTGATVDWIMGYLVIPSPVNFDVERGDTVQLSFDYCPGDELDRFSASVRLNHFIQQSS